MLAVMWLGIRLESQLGIEMDVLMGIVLDQLLAKNCADCTRQLYSPNTMYVPLAML